jgi:hypothetical protein
MNNDDSKKRIKRKKTATRQYFPEETQENIIEYQNELDLDRRREIYIEGIQPSFDKLVENLIFVYGFKTPYDSFQTLKTDCVSFLYESINKWSPDKGTKAFSYFNVVAKNWLIIRSRQAAKRTKRHISIDYPADMTPAQLFCLENHEVVQSPDDVMIAQDRGKVINAMLQEMENFVSNETERTCLNAIQSVFLNIDNLDFLNKRAILVYIRDISGLSPKQLSVSMSSMKKYYKKMTGKDSKFDLF